MTHGSHALDAHEVKRRLEVDPAIGLADHHVAQRRGLHGPNVLPRVRSRRLSAMLIDQIANVIVVLLAVAAAVSWFTGDRAQAMAIVVVLILNAIVGFITEWQSGRALEALRQHTQITVTVRRDGRVMTLPAEELTIGDIVLLASGDRVPADLRVLEAVDLQAEEAALTGESRGVKKTVDAVADDAPLAERSSMLYLATTITSGRGVGIVVATGAGTELGRIGRLVTGIDDTPSALQRKLQQLGKRLVYLVIGIAAVVALTGWLRGDPLWEMVEVGISLAVAAVPEALPAVTTFILASGVLRMARRRAIVRRLAAVETLGSTTVICCDKTGTLTLNRMTVVANDTPEVASAARVAVLCNEASEDIGDPTEVALLDWARKTGMDVARMRHDYPRVSESPFDPRKKSMTTVHRHGDAYLWALKGAPSVVLDACAANEDQRRRVTEANDAMAGRGLRILALAEKVTPTPADKSPYTFLGLLGLTDPPRSGVVEALGEARQAGIRVIMLTGDQLATARAIGRELGLAESDIFARVSPEQKFDIVADLQSRGEIVAVTGDGVNDAPALKKADIGVAMGKRGTEVAKEAADIVLADDNFATIVAAIEGGRNIYANIIRFVHMMFSNNLNEVLTIFVALLLGWPLPLLPLQILWLNLATDIFPAFALALEPGSPDVMHVRPHDPRQPIFSRLLMTTIAWQAVMLAAITLWIYAWALRTYGGGAHARTVALIALVGVQIGHTFNCRSRIRSAFHDLTRNPYLWLSTGIVIALQTTAIAFAPLANILGLVPISRADAIAFGVAVLAPIAIVEIQKFVARRVITDERAP